MIGFSLEASGLYVEPARVIPLGKTPWMQVELLNQGGETKEYYMRIAIAGAEVIAMSDTQAI
jgi:hypothetical protein